MERKGSEVHLDQDEARGGETPHVMRYVLAIGLALAVVAMAAVWITGALSTDESNSAPPTAEAA